MKEIKKAMRTGGRLSCVETMYRDIIWGMDKGVEGKIRLKI